MLYIICCLVLFEMTDGVLTKVLNASEGEIQEAFSVPSQQFGRIYDVISLSGTDQTTLDIINLYYDMDKSVYMPHIADPMKGTLDIERHTVISYIKDSLKLLCKYPIISVDSFLYLTEGGWNISDTSHACIYGSGLEGRQGYLLTDVKDNYGIIHKSKFHSLEFFMEHIISNNEYQNWPIISLIFSPALYSWILFVCTFVFVKMKNRYFLFLISFLWLLFLTILAGPCVLIRYYYPLVISSPVLLCMVNVSVQGNGE